MKTLVGQLVMSVTEDPGVVSLIMAWSHTLVEIDHDHEVISMVILLLLLIQEGSVTSKSMCMKYWFQ